MTTMVAMPPADGLRSPRRLAGRWWVWARRLGVSAILVLVTWRVGTGPFLRGAATVDGWAIAGALGIGGLTTWCSAWRWRLVAGGLGIALPLRTAVAHCYRAVLLNAVLPGGLAGDVHRAVGHGRASGDLGRGARAVLWERLAGQMVLGVVAVGVLLVLPSPVRQYLPGTPAMLAASAGLVAAAFAVAVVCVRGAAHRDGGGGVPGRVVRGACSDIRRGLLARQAWPGVLAASVLAVAGHLMMFLLAAYAVGSTAEPARLLPLILLALLAMSLPLTVGGWGPREGVAAWAFGAAGLSAGDGVATAVGYGVLALVASLPGVAVLAGDRIVAARRAG